MIEQKEEIEDTHIRLIKEEDLPAVAHIYSEAFNQVNIGEEWSEERALVFMSWWYDKQADLFLVAENEGEIVGGVVAGIKPWCDGNHLVDGEIFVSPKEHKRGIAKKLLIEILEKSVQKYNVKELESLADEGEFPLGWYERIGVKRTNWVHISGDASQILDNLKA